MAYARRTRKRYNRTGMLLVAIVVLTLVISVGVSSNNLRKKLAVNQEKIETLEVKLEAEEERAQELEEFARYAKTKAYYEEVARKKLGLVYADEIIFKATE